MKDEKEEINEVLEEENVVNSEIEETEIEETEVDDEVTEAEAEESEPEEEQEEPEQEEETEEEAEEPEAVEEPKKKKAEPAPKKQEKKKPVKQEPSYKDKPRKEEEERKFTQADIDRIVQRKLAKALPPKEEMEQYKKWRESQQTLEEKMSVLRVENQRLNEENENLLHENMVVKAGVDKDAVDFVLFKVEKMEGEFEDNLNNYLKKNQKYITPKTTVVEGAEHKQKPKMAITRKDLDKMGYVERAKYREEHPEEYAKAMGR